MEGGNDECAGVALHNPRKGVFKVANGSNFFNYYMPSKHTRGCNELASTLPERLIFFIAGNIADSLHFGH